MTKIQELDAIVFDVLGTVVDERGSVQDEVAQTLAGNGYSERSTSAGLSTEWTTRLDRAVSDIGAGRAAWESNDVLRRRTLQVALTAFPMVHVDESDRDRLGAIGHRLRPWPDSAQALADLRVSYKVAALSNGDLAQLASFSAAGGLSWHCVCPVRWSVP